METVLLVCLQMQMVDAEEDVHDSTNGSELNKTAETAVAPWVGYNEEEMMKTQILALSKVAVTSLCCVIYCKWHKSSNISCQAGPQIEARS